MRKLYFAPLNFSTRIFVTLSLLLPGIALFAHENTLTSPRATPEEFAVRGELPALPDGVTDLKFHDFFKMPIGPRGLEPTAKLLSLNGKRVRLVGYMAQQEVPSANVFQLTPMPVSLGDEDESLSDDLPASTVFVHLDSTGKPLPYFAGLLQLTGVLSVGAQDEADGHVSTVRLQLDPALTAILLGEQRIHTTTNIT